MDVIGTIWMLEVDLASGYVDYVGCLWCNGAF